MITAEKSSTEETIEAAARKLADYNMEVSPDLAGIYLFPSEDTVRLVMLDPVTLPGEEMTPYYFRSFPQGGVTFPSAIVLIRPEEKTRLALPPGWGDWDDAVQLWPKE